MGNSHREILTSQALKFAVDWLEDNPVQIEPLKRALAEQMEQVGGGAACAQGTARGNGGDGGLTGRAPAHRETQDSPAVVATRLTWATRPCES